VLILDEPTTGLDPNQLEEIRALIREIGKDRTVLLSTHIMQEIKAICNRVIIINKGEIAADYSNLSKMNAFEKGQRQFEVEFLNSVEIADLQAIKNVEIVNSSAEKTFTLIANADIRSEIFDFAVRTNNKLLALKPIEKTMEDIFKQLTK